MAAYIRDIAVVAAATTAANTTTGDRSHQQPQLPRRRGVQYIVVSHKPQVFQAADVLIGVTSSGGGSAAGSSSAVAWAVPH